MKNRKSLKYLLAPVLCAALVTAGLGLPVPAQSLEEEETAGQTVEAEKIADQAVGAVEETADQAAEAEGTEDQTAGASDLITEDGAAEGGDAEDGAPENEAAPQNAGPTLNTDARDGEKQDGEEADDPGDMHEDAFSTEEDSSQAGMEAEDGSASPDEDDGPQAAETSATESPEDGIEEDSDSTETSDVSDASQAAPAEGTGEEIETDTESEEESPLADSSGAEMPAGDSSSESAAGEAAVQDPVSAGTLASAKLTYTGQAQELVVSSSPVDGKLLYSLDGENNGEAIPTGTDAGEYTVFYRLMSADGLTILYEGSLTVTIEKADVIFTPPTANTAEGA